MQVSNDELVEFWHGDEDATGFAHENLIYELCRRLKPKGPRHILERLYPGLESVEDIPLWERKMVDRGYLKRTADCDDRRATKITLTAAGKRALHDAEHAMHARLHDVLSHADDPEGIEAAIADLGEAITRARNERLAGRR